MRFRKLFERTGLTFLLMVLAWSFSFGQGIRPNTNELAENPLAIKVLVFESPVGNYYTLVVVNPNEPDLGYFAKKRYTVEWFSEKGRLISNRIFIRAKCNKRFKVIVTDKITKEVEATMTGTPYCTAILTHPGYEPDPPKY